jgi:hypothetical protein
MKKNSKSEIWGTLDDLRALVEFPSTIKIGSHEVKIKFGRLDELNGEFDSETNTITISDELPYSQAFSTLFHEIFHACNTSIGDTPLGHALIDSLAEQLAQVLSDNATITWVPRNSHRRKP